MSCSTGSPLPAPASKISPAMKADLVAQAFDDRLPLRVVTSPPSKDARGIRVAGALAGYRVGPPRNGSRNEQCDYIRGYDTGANPADLVRPCYRYRDVR